MTILLNTLVYAARPAIPAVAIVTHQFTKKTIALFKNIFDLMQWSFLCLYGSKEILLDRVKNISQVRKNHVVVTQAHRVNRYLNGIFLKKTAFVGPINFNVAHGSLYIASGMVGLAAPIHRLSGKLNQKLPLLAETLGNGLFGLASLVALIQNVKIYRAAAKIPSFAPQHARDAALMLKKSAILGIISSLNYIITVALLVMGSAATFALIFGCIAVVTGCLKILYDYFRFKNAW